MDLQDPATKMSTTGAYTGPGRVCSGPSGTFVFSVRCTFVLVSVAMRSSPLISK